MNNRFNYNKVLNESLNNLLFEASADDIRKRNYIAILEYLKNERVRIPSVDDSVSDEKIVVRDRYQNATEINVPAKVVQLQQMYHDEFFHGNNDGKVARLEPIFLPIALDLGFPKLMKVSPQLNMFKDIIKVIKNYQKDEDFPQQAKPLNQIQPGVTWEWLYKTFNSLVNKMRWNEKNQTTTNQVTEPTKQNDYIIIPQGAPRKSRRGELTFLNVKKYGNQSGKPNKVWQDSKGVWHNKDFSGKLCFTYDEGMWERFTDGGRNRVFLILNKNWEHIPAYTPETKKAYPTAYDDYGKSMIFLFIDEMGQISNSNTRWNHEAEYGERSVDNAFTQGMIRDILGISNFNQVFIPYGDMIDRVREIEDKLNEGYPLSEIFDRVTTAYSEEGNEKNTIYLVDLYIGKNGSRRISNYVKRDATSGFYKMMLPHIWVTQAREFDETGYTKFTYDERSYFMDTDGEVTSDVKKVIKLGNKALDKQSMFETSVQEPLFPNLYKVTIGNLMNWYDANKHAYISPKIWFKALHYNEGSFNKLGVSHIELPNIYDDCMKALAIDINGKIYEGEDYEKEVIVPRLNEVVQKCINGEGDLNYYFRTKRIKDDLTKEDTDFLFLHFIENENSYYQNPLANILNTRTGKLCFDAWREGVDDVTHFNFGIAYMLRGNGGFIYNGMQGAIDTEGNFITNNDAHYIISENITKTFDKCTHNSRLFNKIFRMYKNEEDERFNLGQVLDDNLYLIRTKTYDEKDVFNTNGMIYYNLFDSSSKKLLVKTWFNYFDSFKLGIAHGDYCGTIDEKGNQIVDIADKDAIKEKNITPYLEKFGTNTTDVELTHFTDSKYIIRCRFTNTVKTNVYDNSTHSLLLEEWLPHMSEFKITSLGSKSKKYLMIPSSVSFSRDVYYSKFLSSDGEVISYEDAYKMLLSYIFHTYENCTVEEIATIFKNKLQNGVNVSSSAVDTNKKELDGSFQILTIGDYYNPITCHLLFKDNKIVSNAFYQQIRYARGTRFFMFQEKPSFETRAYNMYYFDGKTNKIYSDDEIQKVCKIEGKEKAKQILAGPPMENASSVLHRLGRQEVSNTMKFLDYDKISITLFEEYGNIFDLNKRKFVFPDWKQNLVFNRHLYYQARSIGDNGIYVYDYYTLDGKKVPHNKRYSFIINSFLRGLRDGEIQGGGTRPLLDFGTKKNEVRNIVKLRVDDKEVLINRATNSLVFPNKLFDSIENASYDGWIEVTKNNEAFYVNMLTKKKVSKKDGVKIIMNLMNERLHKAKNLKEVRSILNPDAYISDGTIKKVSLSVPYGNNYLVKRNGEFGFLLPDIILSRASSFSDGIAEASYDDKNVLIRRNGVITDYDDNVIYTPNLHESKNYQKDIMTEDLNKILRILVKGIK